MRAFFIFLLAGVGAVNEEENHKDFWNKLGSKGIEEALKQKNLVHSAQNVILFIGDGMGISTVTAGRIFKGQEAGKSGEEGFLSFESFPNVGLLKTYNVDKQVADSAGTGTALFTGVKTNYYVVGVDARIEKGKCPSQEVLNDSKLPGLFKWAQDVGKTTGFVTTTRLTHATPAASYAHTPHRDWECDSKIPVEARVNCKDIARQMVEEEVPLNINVLLGGGEQVFRSFINDSSACNRTDGKDLAKEWEETQRKRNKSFSFVRDRESLLKLKPDTERVLGLFASNHLSYDGDRKRNGNKREPTLEEMTIAAITILKNNDANGKGTGFMLIVEGGRIDHAHHDNLALKAVEDVLAFDKAIEAALKEVNDDTLVIVTADHSHSFSINGYPKRGNPIGGISAATEEGFAYQTMSYINGPGFSNHRVQVSDDKSQMLKTTSTWKNLNNSKNDRDEPHLAGYWTESETHGGEDVAAYAKGPFAHLFHTVHEQNHVAYVIAYASCIGPYKDAGPCELNRRRPILKEENDVLSRGLRIQSFYLHLITILAIFAFKKFY